jgi:hypothetical protein
MPCSLISEEPAASIFRMDILQSVSTLTVQIKLELWEMDVQQILCLLSHIHNIYIYIYIYIYESTVIMKKFISGPWQI